LGVIVVNFFFILTEKPAQRSRRATLSLMITGRISITICGERFPARLILKQESLESIIVFFFSSITVGYSNNIKRVSSYLRNEVHVASHSHFCCVTFYTRTVVFISFSKAL